jgi:putative transposase
MWFASSICMSWRAVETHENWLEAHRHLNMNDLKEHKKTQLRQAA